MKNLFSWIRSLKKRLFPPFRVERAMMKKILHPWEWLLHGDEQRWTEWVDAQDVKFEDLVELLQNQNNPFFQARAILVLLVPDWKWLPIHWRSLWSRCAKRNWFPRKVSREILRTMHPKVQQFAGAIIAAMVKYLNAHPGAVADQHVALNAYNDYVLDMLAIGQPTEIAEQLVNCFSVRRYSSPSGSTLPFSRADEFGPFRQLMHDSKIRVRYKRIADQIMRWYIHLTLSQEALYSYSLIAFSTGTTDAVDVELLTDQVNFLAKHPLNSCVSLTPGEQAQVNQVLFKNGKLETATALNRLVVQKSMHIDFSF